MGQGCLPDPRYVFNQQMAAGHQTQHRHADGFGFAPHDLGHVRFQARNGPGCVGCCVTHVVDLRLCHSPLTTIDRVTRFLNPRRARIGPRTTKALNPTYFT